MSTFSAAEWWIFCCLWRRVSQEKTMTLLKPRLSAGPHSFVRAFTLIELLVVIAII